MRAIAQELELSDRTIGNIVHGRGKSRRVAAHIAALLGRPVSRLWPGKYEEAR
ncbi:helix-turn-helix domain-containing protein [Pelomicrobium sp. G1]|uniref:helix-turn-helix domain-containing protein n=1 Tax=Pelomicrobium sp. G1 TaxID=3452920 RepID=UPI003F7667BD